MRRPLFGIMAILSLVLAAGCTLTSTNEPTPIPTPLPPIRVQEADTATPIPPTRPIATPIFPTSTPPISAFATPIPTVNPDLPNPQPGDQTENIVEALINRVIIPAWNFIYTLVTGTIVSLWEFAGLRGGPMAQFIFCLIPGMIVTLWVLWRVFRRGR